MTLRKAHAGEEQTLMRRLADDPFYSLFLLSNLREGLGPESEAWPEEGGGLLMRRAANWMLFPGPHPAAFDYAGAAGIMDYFPPTQVKGMTGRPEVVDALLHRLKRHTGTTYDEHFAALDHAPHPLTYTGTPRRAKREDLAQLAAIYADAGDMSRDAAEVQRMLPTLWVVEADGRIVSAGNIHGETEQAGMIGAVFTPARHRRMGYASTLVHAMSTALFQRGKRPCLFYHNPEAGAIYLHMGYKNIGPWRLVRFGS